MTKGRQTAGKGGGRLFYLLVVYLSIAIAFLPSSIDAVTKGRVVSISLSLGTSGSPPPLGLHTLTPNPDPSVEGFFLFGGIDNNGNISSELWEFSVLSEGLLGAVGGWNRLAVSTFGGRMGHSAYSFIADGFVNLVIFGGADSGTALTLGVPLFNDVHVWKRELTDKTGAGEWYSVSSSGPRPSARTGQAMVPSPLTGGEADGIVIGGFGGGALADLWTITVDNVTNTWQQATGASFTGVYYHGASVVDTDLIVVGGIDSTGNSVSRTFALQLASGNNQVVHANYPNNGGIAGHRTVALSDGTVLPIGGLTSFNSTPSLLTDILAFDSNTSSWSTLLFEGSIGTLNQRLFPGVVKLNLLAPFSLIERVYIYGGFTDAAGTSPSNALLAFDLVEEGNQTVVGTQEPLISSSALTVAFYNNTLAIRTPFSSLPSLNIKFLRFVEMPFQTSNVTVFGPSVAWPSASTFTVSTLSNDQVEGFIATTTLSNGATLGLTGYLSLNQVSFPLGPNTTFTTKAGGFKFALDVSNWAYQNLTATEFLELQVSVYIGGNDLRGGFIEEDSQGISQYVYCTKSSCSNWQIPDVVFADGTFSLFNHEVLSSSQSGDISLSFLFPPFVSSLAFDPDFTLSVPATTFYYSDDGHDLILLLVAIFIPVFFVLVCIVCIVGCVFARLQGSRYIADVPADEDEEEMLRELTDDDDDQHEDGDKNKDSSSEDD